jgi:hypothetical protein
MVVNTNKKSEAWLPQAGLNNPLKQQGEVKMKLTGG